MQWKRAAKDLLGRLGYRIQKISPSQKVHGTNWLEDVARLAGTPLRTVFDVGANTGQTASVFATAFPRATIYSFEPFPDSFAELQANVRHHSRVKPVNAALGERTGSSKFFANAASQTNSLLEGAPAAGVLGDPDSMRPSHSLDVPLDTVDDFCEREGIARLDLLKMDVQGYELKVLQGAERKLRRGEIEFIYSEVLFVDLYKGQAYFQEIYQHLTDRGYGFLGLYGSAYSPDHHLAWADALFHLRR